MNTETYNDEKKCHFCPLFCSNVCCSRWCSPCSYAKWKKKKKMCRKYIVSGNNKSTSLIIWIKYSFFARNFALQLNHLLLASKVMKRLPQIYTVRFALYFNALTKMKVQTKLINTINIYACKTMFMESEKSLVKWVQLIGMGLKSMSKSILEIFFSPFLTH